MKAIALDYSVVKELFAGNPGVVPATTRAVAFVDESHPYSGERTSGRALWIRLLHSARIEMRQQHYGVNWTRKHPPAAFDSHFQLHPLRLGLWKCWFFGQSWPQLTILAEKISQRCCAILSSHRHNIAPQVIRLANSVWFAVLRTFGVKFN